MQTQTREMLLEALTLHELKSGRGDSRQQEAFQELEWRKCARSFNYWRDNYGWLMLKSGAAIRWDKPFPMQSAQGDAWQRNESTIEVKSRQLGETTNASHFAVWDCMFHDAVKWNLFGAGQDESQDIINRVDATLDRLPSWMLERARRTPGLVAKDRSENEKRKHKQEGIRTISFGLSKIEVRTGSVKKAQGLSGKVFADDWGKHTEQARKWQLMYPVIDDPEISHRGQIIMVFNGNGEDHGYHLFQKAKSGRLKLRASFFNWMEDPRRLEGSTVGGKPIDGMPLSELVDAYKAGTLLCPWYEEAKENYLIENPDADEYSFKAQYPTTEDEAFYISGNSRFRLSVINEYADDLRARRSACESVRKHNPGAGKPFSEIGYLEGNSFQAFVPDFKGKLRVWSRPEPNERYIIGCDPSGGTEAGDFAVADVYKLVHSDLIQQVALYRARCEPSVLAYEVEKLGHAYNDAFIVVEANNHGGIVLDRLKPSYFNLYMRKQSFSKFTNPDTDNIGFWADSHNKKRVVDQLAEWLNGKRLVLNNAETLKELANYEIRDNDTTAAKTGMHDDLVAGLYLAVEGAVDLANFFVDTQVRDLMPWED